MAKQQWFNTLNEALASESTPKHRDLIAEWPLGRNISYGETVSVATAKRFISVYRSVDGLYERPFITSRSHLNERQTLSRQFYQRQLIGRQTTSPTILFTDFA